MYINDLTDAFNSTVRLFADDALLYGTICCDEDTADLQDYLYRLEDWQQKRKMEFNRSKCKKPGEIHQSGNTYSVEKF